MRKPQQGLELSTQASVGANVTQRTTGATSASCNQNDISYDIRLYNFELRKTVASRSQMVVKICVGRARSACHRASDLSAVERWGVAHPPSHSGDTNTDTVYDSARNAGRKVPKNGLAEACRGVGRYVYRSLPLE